MSFTVHVSAPHQSQHELVRQSFATSYVEAHYEQRLSTPTLEGTITCVQKIEKNT